jgi:imidazolonepropionase-like amidohydrolase
MISGLVRTVVFAGFACTLLAASAEAATALRFGKMADGSGKTTADAVIVVDGDKIVSVGSGQSAIPTGATVIDLRKYTAIPGLIDAHTHISWVWDEAPGTTPYRQSTRTVGENVFLAQKNLLHTLEAGVTTVRDLNAQQEGADIAVRNLVNRGAMVGPRMFVATHGIFSSPRAVGGVAGVPEMIREVRAVIANGADWVKIFASTGGTQNLTGDQTLTLEELKAAVEVAHPLGKKIAVHSYGPAGAKAAVMAGVDTIEHAIDMDDETLAMMKAKGITYIPTIDHNRFYADNAIPFEFRKGIGDEYHEFIAKNIETTRRALKAGVKVGMGSDAVYTMAGENTRELGALVKAGMTPAQALAAATTINAAMLGKEKSLGTIAPGYFADIVAVEGDPLADVNVTINNVRWVMKSGKVVVDKTAAK